MSNNKPQQQVKEYTISMVIEKVVKAKNDKEAEHAAISEAGSFRDDAATDGWNVADTEAIQCNPEELEEIREALEYAQSELDKRKAADVLGIPFVGENELDARIRRAAEPSREEIMGEE